MTLGLIQRIFHGTEKFFLKEKSVTGMYNLIKPEGFLYLLYFPHSCTLFFVSFYLLFPPLPRLPPSGWFIIKVIYDYPVLFSCSFQVNEQRWRFILIKPSVTSNLIICTCGNLQQEPAVLKDSTVLGCHTLSHL